MIYEMRLKREVFPIYQMNRKTMKNWMLETWRRNSTQNEMTTIMIKILLKEATLLQAMITYQMMRCLEFCQQTYETNRRKTRKVCLMPWENERKTNFENLRSRRKKIEACKSQLWRKYLQLRILSMRDCESISSKSLKLLMLGLRQRQEMTIRSQWWRKILNKHC